MAKVLVCVPVEGKYPLVYPFVKRLVKCDKHKVHKITTDPNKADLILFFSNLRPYFEKIRQSSTYKRYKEKSFLITDKDRFIPFLPGLYASLEKKYFDENRQSGWSYLGITEKEYIGFRNNYEDAEYLFSFMGSAKTNRIRKKILRIDHPSAMIINTDSNGKNPDTISNSTEEYRRKYVELISKSKFVLCPRGLGTSSFRLYETMIIGRVPVIISDEFVLPEGPDWLSFSIRIDEKNIGSIPGILKENEYRFKEMGLKARSEWEKWFSDENFFHNSVEACLRLMETKNNYHIYKFYAQLFRPFHIARAIKSKAKNLINNESGNFTVLKND